MYIGVRTCRNVVEWAAQHPPPPSRVAQAPCSQCPPQGQIGCLHGVEETGMKISDPEAIELWTGGGLMQMHSEVGRIIWF